MTLEDLDILTAVIKISIDGSNLSIGDATLAYIALNKRGWDDDGIIWRQATKKEFLDYHDFDDILGSEDDALNSEDSIFCSDGILLGCQILGDD